MPIGNLKINVTLLKPARNYAVKVPGIITELQ
jgi:hypothetical protein